MTGYEQMQAALRRNVPHTFENNRELVKMWALVAIAEALEEIARKMTGREE